MTNLQLDRNNWLEAKRHNSAVEAENQRHNQEQERLTGEANAEAARANRAREEATSYSNETARISALETQRSNLAREAENFRHNKTSEQNDRIIARMTNSREWAKISLTQQRNDVQNSLDLSKKEAQDLDNLITKVQIDLGMPELQVKKLRAEKDKIMNDILLAQKEFALDKAIKEGNLNLAERKQILEENLAGVKKAQEIAKTINEWKKVVLGDGKSGSNVGKLLDFIKFVASAVAK